MSSKTIQTLSEQSRLLKLISKQMCCITNSVNTGVGNVLVLRGLFFSPTSEMGELTIDEETAGTYTSITDDGASGDITINYKPFGGAFGGYAAFSSPLVLSVGDVINVKRTITSGDGWYSLKGIMNA